jgi:hypothetical protein
VVVLIDIGMDWIDPSKKLWSLKRLAIKSFLKK